MGHADGIGYLKLTALGQPCGDDVFCHPASRIGTGTVYLGGVLPGEGPAAVRDHAAVGIDHDLASGHAGITHRPANYKTPRTVDKIVGLLVQHVRRNHLAHDLLDDIGLDLLLGDLGSVLGGDHHRVYSRRLAIAVFYRHLRLAIRAQIGQCAVPAHRCQTLHQTMGEHNGHGHQLRGLGAGIAEHHALVSGPHALDFLIAHLAQLGLLGLVHAQGDIRRLLFDRRDHTTGVVVKAIVRAIIADPFDRLARHTGDIHIARGRNLASDEDQPRGRRTFAGHATIGILSIDGVENGVGYLVADLVRMPFRHRLGGKHEFGRIHKVVHLSFVFPFYRARGKAEKYRLSDVSLHGCPVKCCPIGLFVTALP